MLKLPPELVQLIMAKAKSLKTLRSLILVNRYFWEVFLSGRTTILAAVVENQFGCAMREAIFIASGQACAANSTEERVRRVKLLHMAPSKAFTSPMLAKLVWIGQVMDDLANIFSNDIAPELWTKAIRPLDGKAPSSFKHSQLRLKRALLIYWVIIGLYSEFDPSTRFFFHNSLDKEPFHELYRHYPARVWIDVVFFEHIFFPRFMKNICGECQTKCYGQLHNLVFSRGPEEMLKLYNSHSSDKTLNRNYLDGAPPRFLGLREELIHGIVELPSGMAEYLVEPCYEWAIFELDGLDKHHQHLLQELYKGL